MAEPIELNPLKQSIPPDLQRQVEDIQKKVASTTGIQNMLLIKII